MSTEEQKPARKGRVRPGGRTARVRSSVLRAVQAELLESGYANLSHRGVAKRAGINPATVYRRWPTVADLLADLLINLGSDLVPVPDTGALKSDFEAYLDRICLVLEDPAMRRIIQAMVLAGTDGNEEIREAVRRFWHIRFEGAYVMLDRAVLRGEAPTDGDREQSIEVLVAPVWFRVFIAQKPISATMKDKSVRAALLVAGCGQAAPSPDV